MDANAVLKDRLSLLRSFRHDAETSQAEKHKHAGDNKHNFQRLHFGSPLDWSSWRVLLVELFLRTERAQHGYESYVASQRPVCNGIRLNVKLTNGW